MQTLSHVGLVGFSLQHLKFPLALVDGGADELGCLLHTCYGNTC